MKWAPFVNEAKLDVETAYRKIALDWGQRGLNVHMLERWVHSDHVHKINSHWGDCLRYLELVCVCEKVNVGITYTFLLNVILLVCYSSVLCQADGQSTGNQERLASLACFSGWFQTTALNTDWIVVWVEFRHKWPLVLKTVIALNIKDGSHACAAWMFETE